MSSIHLILCCVCLVSLRLPENENQKEASDHCQYIRAAVMREASLDPLISQTTTPLHEQASSFWKHTPEEPLYEQTRSLCVTQPHRLVTNQQSKEQLWHSPTKQPRYKQTESSHSTCLVSFYMNKPDHPEAHTLKTSIWRSQWRINTIWSGCNLLPSSPCMNKPGHSVRHYMNVPDHPSTHTTETSILTSLVSLEHTEEAPAYERDTSCSKGHH